MAQGTTCPHPATADSDGDTLADGDEVNLGTNPCSADTDGDQVSDDVDPLPTEPGVTEEFLEQLARDVADEMEATDLVLFNGPNNNANKGRRNSLSSRLRNGAKAIGKGDLEDALDLITNVLQRIDGVSPPNDWMDESTERNDLALDLLILTSLTELELIGG